ncbi:hypothetical protein HDU67_007730 [Dinochytrium kinnereticum]|nr:hypothetical protein HDU67_007730 [Dinochytrium kinnereticum]
MVKSRKKSEAKGSSSKQSTLLTSANGNTKFKSPNTSKSKRVLESVAAHIKVKDANMRDLLDQSVPGLLSQLTSKKKGKSSSDMDESDQAQGRNDRARTRAANKTSVDEVDLLSIRL